MPPEFSGEFPGKPREFPKNFAGFPGGPPGNFPRVSRRFPGNGRPKATARQPSRTWGAPGWPRGPFPGKVPGMSREFPRNFPGFPGGSPGNFPRVSRRFPGIGRPSDCLATLWHMGRCRPASRPFPGKVPGISREFSRNFPRFPGGSPGNFPRVSRRFPAIARPKVTASQPCRTWGALGRPRGPFLTLSRSCVSGGSERSELRAERGEGVPGTCRGRAGDVLVPFTSLFYFPCLSPSL